MRALVILVIMLFGISVFAHDPTEVSYVFEEDELTIHLTPKGALDLISSIYPKLADQESIHLSSYIQDYEDYFNDRIDIQSAGKSIRLAYMMSDLTKHDSFIRFRLLNFQKDYSMMVLDITAFEDVYRHVSNETMLPHSIRSGDATMSDDTGFSVLKEKFIEEDYSLQGFIMSIAPLLILFAIVLFLTLRMGKFLIAILRK